jgi:dynein light intermediate chain 1
MLTATQLETLARLSIYTLSTPSPAFGPLLKPLLTPSSLPNTLVVILLDWSQPWHWIRQLHSWISLLRSLIVSLDDESKHALDANLSHMRGRGHKRSNTADSNVSVEGEEELPLGPGEWDEPLGVPLAVVALNTDKMGVLERAGWNDAQFDFIGQFLRTILLKHGGSLIYTMPSSQGQGALQSLVHAGLGVRSGLVKRDSGTVYEVSRREGTLVPSNWDSWAKIRMMADQFDPEVVSKAWSTDIQASPSATAGSQEPKEDESHTTAIALYESTITNPKSASSSTTSSNNVSTALEVSSKDVQAFLGEQAKVLEEFQVSDRKERMAQESSKSNKGSSLAADGEAGRHVEEHIGPVQFNMGGIQVDAEEMVRKIRVSFPTCSLFFVSRGPGD